MSDAGHGRPATAKEEPQRGWGEGVDLGARRILKKGWRNTYLEHPFHVRHRAHVPVTDGLIEGLSKLHRSEGRAAVWSERRSRSERMRDGR